ncbi:MAG: shikimate dehydrogenase [Pseudomonadota bacterium]
MFAIVANPVAHVRTPQVFNEYFRAHGIDAVLVPVEVSPERLPAMLDGFRAMTNLAGFVATMPHKTAMVGLCDEVTRTARLIGAANTVRRDPDGRLVGTMFDGDGFVAGLRAQGHEPRGRRVYLAGAGGAASAIAFAFAEAGVACLTLHNRTTSKAAELADRVRAACPHVAVSVGSADPSGHELVINGTSLGLKPDDALPIDTAKLTPDMVVGEVVMLPETTALLAAATARGCPIHHGRHMLDEQIRLMAAFMGATG